MIILLKNYNISAPGSLMIMGEHAVLYHQPAIVAAIDKFLTVRLQVTKAHTAVITIYSDLYHEPYIFALKDLFTHVNHEQPCLNYCLAVILQFKKELLLKANNLTFKISSTINSTLGLGSSGALVAASVAVILKYLDEDISIPKLQAQTLKLGHKIIQTVQGVGSGADLAASIYGKVLYYKLPQYHVKTLSDFIPLSVVYSGYKLSTKEVINTMATKSNITQPIFKVMAKIVNLAKLAIIAKDWTSLGYLFNVHYGLQEALQLSDQHIANIIHTLRKATTITGAKISGSGLGDCIIGLGTYDKVNHNLNFVATKITSLGLHESSSFNSAL